jgi:hypothetical protein
MKLRKLDYNKSKQPEISFDNYCTICTYLDLKTILKLCMVKKDKQIVMQINHITLYNMEEIYNSLNLLKNLTSLTICINELVLLTDYCVICTLINNNNKLKVVNLYSFNNADNNILIDISDYKIKVFCEFLQIMNIKLNISNIQVSSIEDIQFAINLDICPIRLVFDIPLINLNNYNELLLQLFTKFTKLEMIKFNHSITDYIIELFKVCVNVKSIYISHARYLTNDALNILSIEFPKLKTLVFNNNCELFSNIPVMNKLTMLGLSDMIQPLNIEILRNIKNISLTRCSKDVINSLNIINNIPENKLKTIYITDCYNTISYDVIHTIANTCKYLKLVNITINSLNTESEPLYNLFSKKHRFIVQGGE